MAIKYHQHGNRLAMMFRHLDDITPSILPLPDLPKQVDIDDLHDNGKLLTDAHISMLQTELKQREDVSYFATTITRYSKCSLRGLSKYGVTYINGTLHAIYKGVKHNKHLGNGIHGRAKLAQNMKTGEWVAYKIQRIGDHLSKPPTDVYMHIDNEHKHTQDMQLDRMTLHHHVSYKKQEHQYNYAMIFTAGMRLDALATSARYKKKKTIFWLQIIIAILQAADILHTTHRKIHCDIKPDNVIIDIEKMSAMLIDFGMTLNMPRDATIHYHRLLGAPLYVDYPHRTLFKQQCYYENRPPNDLLTYSPVTDTFALAITIANMLDLHIYPSSYADFDPDNNYICKPGHDLFENNTKIQDKTLLRHLVIYLDKMAGHDLNARPTITEAMAYFNALLQEQQNDNTKNQIATLHVDDVIHLSAEEQKQFINQISNDANIWKICLLDSQQRDIKTYLKLKQLLEDADLPVCSYVITHRNKSALIKHASASILKMENRTRTDIHFTHLPVDHCLGINVTTDKFNVLTNENPTPRHACILQ